MGLDACVYCNCFEPGKLRCPPPKNISLRVAPNGALDFDSSRLTMEERQEWDRWEHSFACEHKGGMLLQHRLGNISSIAIIRELLNTRKADFRLLLEQAVYNGTHGGDYISADKIPTLAKEISLITGMKCHSKDEAKFLDLFREQMHELTQVALAHSKPIAF